MRKMLVKVVLPLAILLFGVVAFAALLKSRPAAQRVDRPYLGPLVESIEAPAQSLQIIVEGQGTVQPKAEIDLVPQVAGVILWKSPQLAGGGYFQRGDVLARIDPADYQLGLAQAQAQVAQAQYRLDIAHQEAQIAQQEWQLVQGGRAQSDAPTPLVLRQPQLQAAKIELKAAKANLDLARLRLDRTQLKAPFSGRVRSARIDVGQYVAPGQIAARLYSTEKAEIALPVAPQELAWIDWSPAAASSQMQRTTPEGTPYPDQRLRAEIKGTYAGQKLKWNGQLARTEGEIDPLSRMVRLVVEVDDPYGGEQPLMVGLFVDVDIYGRTVDDVRVLPRSALRSGSTVWVVDSQGQLSIRAAQLVRSRGEQVLVRTDLAADEKIVVSQLSGVTDGMKVRFAQGDK